MILFKRRKTKHLNREEIEAFENSYVSKANHVIWRNVEGRAVILNTKSASYFTLEGTALRIWQLIDKGTFVTDLARTISDEYGKKVDAVKRDLKEFLASMKEECIIEIKPRGGLDGEEE